jgi:hypothetical protein
MHPSLQRIECRSWAFEPGRSRSPDGGAEGDDDDGSVRDHLRNGNERGFHPYASIAFTPSVASVAKSGVYAGSVVLPG